MTTPTLDALDRKILDVLQNDGRASNVEISAKVHLSAPQCFRRVRSLEERGVIRGYRAQVQPEALGLGVMAYVSLTIDGGQFGRVREIEASIRDFPQILECHTVSGDYDYLLKVVARDLKSLSQFLSAGSGRRAIDDLPGRSQVARRIACRPGHLIFIVQCVTIATACAAGTLYTVGMPSIEKA